MSEQFPLVCICIPTYNAERTILETLESVLAQTYSNLVIHISDNASSDNTLKIIESVADPRVIIHRNVINIGGEGNFTRCIQLAEGKYTAIFHSDDIYEQNIVAKQVAFLEANADVGTVFTEAITIDEQGLPLGLIGRAPGGIGGVVRFEFCDLLQTILFNHNFLVCPSAMVRTAIYTTEIKEWGAGMFRSASDVDMWLRLARIQTIAVLNEPLMRYRISSMQFSNKIRNRTERTDFFLVMDHYLCQAEVRSFITNDDLRHYGWLERHERVARALNLFVLGKGAEAKGLLHGMFCKDAVCAAIHSRRGMVTLAGCVLLQLLSLAGASGKCVAIAKAIKKISWR